MASQMTGPLLVQLLSSFALPITVVIVAVVLRGPLAGLVTSLGGRITKLSLFKVEITLAEPAAAPMLDDLRGAAGIADVDESSSRLLKRLQEGEPVQIAAIDLGTGKEWLTSRIYIAAIMLERMRGVHSLLFLHTEDGISRHFLALAPAGRVHRVLATRYPWLETAWMKACGSVAKPAAPGVPAPQRMTHTEMARALVLGFIDAVQADKTPPYDQREWVDLAHGKRERAAWVDRKTLSSLLPDDLESWAYAARDDPRARRVRAILRRKGDFVALLEPGRKFSGAIVDRRALLEQLAAATSEEPDAR